MTQKWLWAIIIVSTAPVIGIFVYGFIEQILYNREFGSNPVSDSIMLILAPFVIIMILSINYLLFKVNLYTQIDSNSIKYKFFPFHINYRIILWEQVKRAYIRQYNPIKEYGGWGLKWSSTNAAYNIMGNVGLQLVLQNGKKILIGTQKPEELRSFLISIDRYKE